MLVLASDSRCDVCLESFLEDTKDPAAIACGHCFCRPCLYTLSYRSCPICRKSFHPQEMIKLHVEMCDSSLGLVLEKSKEESDYEGDTLIALRSGDVEKMAGAIAQFENWALSQPSTSKSKHALQVVLELAKLVMEATSQLNSALMQAAEDERLFRIREQSFQDQNHRLAVEKAHLEERLKQRDFTAKGANQENLIKSPRNSPRMASRSQLGRSNSPNLQPVTNLPLTPTSPPDHLSSVLPPSHVTQISSPTSILSATRARTMLRGPRERSGSMSHAPKLSTFEAIQPAAPQNSPPPSVTHTRASSPSSSSVANHNLTALVSPIERSRRLPATPMVPLDRNASQNGLPSRTQRHSVQTYQHSTTQSLDGFSLKTPSLSGKDSLHRSLSYIPSHIPPRPPRSNPPAPPVAYSTPQFGGHQKQPSLERKSAIRRQSREY